MDIYLLRPHWRPDRSEFTKHEFTIAVLMLLEHICTVSLNQESFKFSSFEYIYSLDVGDYADSV